MFSASPDATIRIWSVPNASCVQVVRAHEGSVTGLSLHATGDYLLSSSDDQVRPIPAPQTPLNCFSSLCTQCAVPLFQYWAFSDIQTGRVLTKVTDESSGCGKAECPHPGGLLRACRKGFFLPVGPSRSQGLVWEGFANKVRKSPQSSESPPVSPQLSPAPSSTRTGSFLEQGRWTLRSRFGI